MKNLLRKWLEVSDGQDMSGYARVDDIKEMVEDAIYEALQPELPYEYKRLYWRRDRDKDIRGTLERCVKKIVREDARAEVQGRIAELTEPEAFIDNVVERIKSKQLTA